jgi:mercuric ion transport protein
MSEHAIDLVYFDDCPNAQEARDNLRAAVGAEDRSTRWREWNLSEEATPERFRRFGSPTILVDGRDVTGDGGGSEAMACRADGAPDVEVIRRALSR